MVKLETSLRSPRLKVWPQDVVEAANSRIKRNTKTAVRFHVRSNFLELLKMHQCAVW